MKIDIEKKVDELLVVILREKVNEYFGGKPKARNLVKIAKDPGAALQRVGDEVADIENQMDPRTKHGTQTLLMHIGQGARTINTMAENMNSTAVTVQKYLKILAKQGQIEKLEGEGWVRVK